MLSLVTIDMVLVICRMWARYENRSDRGATMYFDASSQYVCWSWVREGSSYYGWLVVACRVWPGVIF